MEVIMEPVEGQSPPLDTFLSMRIGDVQKQSRFASSRTYRFPDPGDNRAGFGRIEVFQRIGHLTVGFDNLEGNPQDIEVPCGQLGQPLRIRVAVKGSSAKEKGAGAPDLSTEKKCRTKQRLDAAQKYLAEHKLESALADAMREVIANKPQDPHQYLCAQIMKHRPVPEGKEPPAVPAPEKADLAAPQLPPAPEKASVPKAEKSVPPPPPAAEKAVPPAAAAPVLPAAEKAAAPVAEKLEKATAPVDDKVEKAATPEPKAPETRFGDYYVANFKRVDLPAFPQQEQKAAPVVDVVESKTTPAVDVVESKTAPAVDVVESKTAPAASKVPETRFREYYSANFKMLNLSALCCRPAKEVPATPEAEQPKLEEAPVEAPKPAPAPVEAVRAPAKEPEPVQRSPAPTGKAFGLRPSTGTWLALRPAPRALPAPAVKEAPRPIEAGPPKAEAAPSVIPDHAVAPANAVVQESSAHVGKNFCLRPSTGTWLALRPARPAVKEPTPAVKPTPATSREAEVMELRRRAGLVLARAAESGTLVPVLESSRSSGQQKSPRDDELADIRQRTSAVLAKAAESGTLATVLANSRKEIEADVAELRKKAGSVLASAAEKGTLARVLKGDSPKPVAARDFRLRASVATWLAPAPPAAAEPAEAAPPRAKAAPAPAVAVAEQPPSPSKPAPKFSLRPSVNTWLAPRPLEKAPALPKAAALEESAPEPAPVAVQKAPLAAAAVPSVAKFMPSVGTWLAARPRALAQPTAVQLQVAAPQPALEPAERQAVPPATTAFRYKPSVGSWLQRAHAMVPPPAVQEKPQEKRALPLLPERKEAPPKAPPPQEGARSRPSSAAGRKKKASQSSAALPTLRSKPTDPNLTAPLKAEKSKPAASSPKHTAAGAERPLPFQYKPSVGSWLVPKGGQRLQAKSETVAAPVAAPVKSQAAPAAPVAPSAQATPSAPEAARPFTGPFQSRPSVGSWLVRRSSVQTLEAAPAIQQVAPAVQELAEVKASPAPDVTVRHFENGKESSQEVFEKAFIPAALPQEPSSVVAVTKPFNERPSVASWLKRAPRARLQAPPELPVEKAAPVMPPAVEKQAEEVPVQEKAAPPLPPKAKQPEPTSDVAKMAMPEEAPTPAKPFNEMPSVATWFLRKKVLRQLPKAVEVAVPAEMAPPSQAAAPLPAAQQAASQEPSAPAIAAPAAAKPFNERPSVASWMMRRKAPRAAQEAPKPAPAAEKAAAPAAAAPAAPVQFSVRPSVGSWLRAKRGSSPEEAYILELQNLVADRDMELERLKVRARKQGLAEHSAPCSPRSLRAPAAVTSALEQGPYSKAAGLLRSMPTSPTARALLRSIGAKPEPPLHVRNATQQAGLDQALMFSGLYAKFQAPAERQASKETAVAPQPQLQCAPAPKRPFRFLPSAGTWLIQVKAVAPEQAVPEAAVKSPKEVAAPKAEVPVEKEAAVERQSLGRSAPTTAAQDARPPAAPAAPKQWTRSPSVGTWLRTPAPRVEAPAAAPQQRLLPVTEMRKSSLLKASNEDLIRSFQDEIARKDEEILQLKRMLRIL